MEWIGFIVNLIGGALGGLATGAAWKEKSLGSIGNAIAGIVGGVAGSYILQAVGILNTMGLANVTVGSLLGHAGTSFVGGGVLTAIIGMIKGAMKK